jgi:hypothetical protein
MVGLGVLYLSEEVEEIVGGVVMKSEGQSAAI